MPVDGTEGCLRAFVQLKQQYCKMKVILSIGGGGKGSENFAAVARSRSSLDTFARTARALVDQYGLDGIDGEMVSMEVRPWLIVLCSRLGTSRGLEAG